MPVATFDPARDGFSFPNRWELDTAERDALRDAMTRATARAVGVIAPAFPAAWLPLRLAPRLAGAIATAVPDGYGLCGGMAFAALDFQRARAGVNLAAMFDARPSVGSPLYLYLWQRLLDSLALNGATFLGWKAMLRLVPSAWPFRGGAGWLLARTREQVTSLRPRLSAGELVPLGLVGDQLDPFQDHQVLAYDWQPTATGTRILVYDMNCPGGAQTIDLDLRGPALAAEESCRGTRGRLRGLFCETYRGVEPPL